MLPWKGKYQSICVKITLIYALFISRFTYLLMVLPTPSNRFLNYMSKNVSILFGMASQTKLKGPIYIRIMITYKPLTINAVQEIELIKYLLNITITRLYTGVNGTESMCGGTG